MFATAGSSAANLIAVRRSFSAGAVLALSREQVFLLARSANHRDKPVTAMRHTQSRLSEDLKGCSRFTRRRRGEDTLHRSYDSVLRPDLEA